MELSDIQSIPQTRESLWLMARALKVKEFMDGRHDVLARKDFTFKGEPLRTAKIVLQICKAIVDFHNAYLVGNPVTLTGAEGAVKLFNSIYAATNYALTDYRIVNALTQYGDAFEYVYRDRGVIRSKVFDNLCAYPVYDERNIYRAFLEYWKDVITGDEFYTLYEPERVTEYAVKPAGTLVKTSEHVNLTGLPIHYKSGVEAEFSAFGVGVVEDLIPIVNEIEALLSKTVDAVTTLSLNPLGVSSGQRIVTNIDKDMVGAMLNLEDGGRFDYASATIDHATVELLLHELVNQFYAVAQVPSVVFNGNVSNVSEVSLKLLFTQLDNKSKRTATYLKEGFYARWEAMRKLMREQITDAEFDSLDVVFNYNRPTDYTATVNDLAKQYAAGAMSKKTFIEKSPYTDNAEVEMAQIEEERNKQAEV